MLSAGGEKVISIGASTGGVDALSEVLKKFTKNTPPIVLTIHLPNGMTKIYADQLDDELKMEVKEAESGDLLNRGKVLIAPSMKHMKVVRKAGLLAVECFAGEKVQHALPSVDVLFESVAREVGENAVGVILTGIGSDGARGLKEMRNRGAQTIGQDEKTSVIYGMPKVAKEMGAVKYELPIDKIADKIISLL
ncbi:MAG: CheB methylesterase domain-containing protein [Defluviitaleaceae bacterium]|nr:CheB methylesterase domain-containing protein [Defluviitaleaceae bacterium]